MYYLLTAAFILNLLLLPVWFVARFIFVYNKNKRTSLQTELLDAAIFIYIVSIIAITMIPLSGDMSVPSEHHISLIPLATTIRTTSSIFTKSNHLVELRHVLENTVGNIIMFIPAGIFLTVKNKKMPIGRLIVTAAFCSACIETTQFIEGFFHIIRFVDMDDVILNTLGGVVGYRWYNKSLKKYF